MSRENPANGKATINAVIIANFNIASIISLIFITFCCVAPFGALVGLTDFNVAVASH